MSGGNPISKIRGAQILDLTFKLGARQENKDGSVSVEILVTSKQEKRGGGTETDHRKYAATFVKAGEEWRARDLYEPCRWCSSTGTCKDCKGSGKCRECGGKPAKENNRCDNCKEGSPCKDCVCDGCEGSKACGNCRGSKACRNCKGKGVRLLPPGGRRKPSMELAPEGQTFSTDLSTPESTARSYIDSGLQQDSMSSAAVLHWEEERRKKLEPYFHAGRNAKLRSVIEEKTRPARKNFLEKEKRFQPGPVNTEGDTARVIVELKRGADGRGRWEKNRLLMTRVNDTWLISAVQSGCRSCDQTGKCPSCGGSDSCSACDDSKRCNKCDGKGWEDTRR